MNLYDDYLSIFAETDEALNEKLAEMAGEGWTHYGELIRMKVPSGLYLELARAYTTQLIARNRATWEKSKPEVPNV